MGGFKGAGIAISAPRIGLVAAALHLYDLVGSQVLLRGHQKATAPFVDRACGDRDRVFRPTIIRAEFSIADVARPPSSA